MSRLLETRGLSKAFGGIRAVDGVNLALEDGIIHALIGPNGAGKTTLFNILTGHLRPDAGTIRFRGGEIAGRAPYVIWRQGLSRTFQIPAVFRNLTVLENLQIPLLARRRRTLDLLGRPPRVTREEAFAMLTHVGLGDQATRLASVLPYGDLKRLELALALVSRPCLLLLDEPTAGTAPHERHELMGLIERTVETLGVTLLFTEHDMDVVFGIAARITVLHQGRVIAEGTPKEVRGNPEVQAIYLGEG
jgi:branched-chain amino acid transport system ATP-binding protein